MLTEQEILLEAAAVLNEEIIRSFQQQGHTLTGAWEESVHAEVLSDNEVIGLAKSYGAIVDAGVTPGSIPYSGNGNGGTSKYIQGLFNFWKLRKPGITDKEALSLAFATAKAQKKQGMSTWASRDYSATKERQRFIDQAFVDTEKEVTDTVFTGLTTIVNQSIVEEKELVY